MYIYICTCCSQILSHDYNIVVYVFILHTILISMVYMKERGCQAINVYVHVYMVGGTF